MAVNPVGQRAYLRPVATRSAQAQLGALSRPVAGNRVSNTFTDREALAKLIRDVDRAHHKIQFETFLFSGEDGNKLADALIRAHRRGVPVQVLLDDMGQRNDHYQIANRLKAAGIEVRTYPKSALSRSYAIDHAKLAVIDDRISWAGGVNFDPEINRDMMTRVEGPAVSRFQRTFHQGWLLAGGKVLPVKADASPKGDVTIQIAQTALSEHTTRQQVLSELERTQKGDRIDLWMMDLGDHQVLKSVLAAADRGVQVRALIDSDVGFMKPGLIGRIQHAILAGVPDLYSVKRLLQKGIDVHYYKPPSGLTKLHAKVWLLTRNVGKATQERRVIGGSVNALKSAYEFNHELGFVMSGPHVGEDVARQFEHDFTQDSTRVGKLSFMQSLKAELVRLLTRFFI